jgi:HPt (histidine-containing phosphotransfer) domain-containing protein
MTKAPAFRCCQPGLLFEAVDRDAGIFLDLAQIFIQETIARFDDIARMSAAGAYSGMGHEAHSLKGTVGAVGAAGLVQLLQHIEAAGLQHRRPCSEAQLAQLRQGLQLARGDMDAYTAMLKQSL